MPVDDSATENRWYTSLFHWWRDHVVVSVAHQDVLAQVHDDSSWNGRFAFMTLMSAGIAILGLLLSSPAVVIGAMLISPLMGPIIGLGFSLATFDSQEIRRSLTAMALGVVLAVLFCALIVLLSPLQNVTPEIASRTRPNLFDLMVALFSALAGAYATIRGRAGTVVGVAIATALMPPLAVVGFGLATLNRAVFVGAAVLFFTNFMTIALAAAVMARLYRFGPQFSPRQTAVQTVVLLATFTALAVPLGLALRQVAWEAVANRQARDVLTAEFGAGSRVAQLALDYDADPIRVTGTVFTPRVVTNAERATTAQLTQMYGRPVDVTLEQIHVDAGEADAQAGQTSVADEVAALQRAAASVAERVSLIAGVAPGDVMVDRVARQVAVRAVALPGASLGTYRTLERRVAAASPGWEVMVTPPPAPPGRIVYDAQGGITLAGRAALADAGWAAVRLGLPIVVAGPPDRVEPIVAALTQVGITATRAPTGQAGGGNDVTLSWAAPGLP